MRIPIRRAGLTTVVGCALLLACVAGTASSELPDDPELEARSLSDVQRNEVLARIEAVGRRGFLYEVSSPATDVRAGKKLFLYGTMHLGRAGSEPFNGPVIGALRQSHRMALEADPSDGATTQQIALQLGQYDASDALDRHIPPALMARVSAFGETHGVPPERVARFRPWLLANMVVLTDVAGAGLDPAMGSEMYLAGFARASRMQVVEIEGLESQLRLFAALPEALQNAQLEEAFAEKDRGESQAQTLALFDLWMRGDADAGDAIVAEMRRDAGDKLFERYFMDTLIDRRNRTMADKAEHYLERPGNTFFAVGALHLFGDSGLVRELRRRGYRVIDLQPPRATVR